MPTQRFGVLILLTLGLVHGKEICHGIPKTLNGRLCASTQNYDDGHMGACGCGHSNWQPFQWMTNKYTTAPNQMFFDIGGSEWCGYSCGICVKLTTTGGYISGLGLGHQVTANQSVTFMVTNVCPVEKYSDRCGQSTEPFGGGVNKYGYAVHFDLEDHMHQVSNGLGWKSAEVLWEVVNCDTENTINNMTPSSNDYSQCQCHSKGK